MKSNVYVYPQGTYTKTVPLVHTLCIGLSIGQSKGCIEHNGRFLHLDSRTPAGFLETMHRLRLEMPYV